MKLSHLSWWYYIWRA